MEKYRGKIRRQIWLNSVGIIALAAIQLLAFSGIIEPAVADGHWDDMWNGFIAGAAFGIMALLIAMNFVNGRALRSEKAIKKLYIKENDEREQRIWTEARSAGAKVFLIGGLVAGIAAGYFSISVSISIIACVLIHSLICGALKLYYARKY